MARALGQKAPGQCGRTLPPLLCFSQPCLGPCPEASPSHETTATVTMEKCKRKPITLSRGFKKRAPIVKRRVWGYPYYFFFFSLATSRHEQQETKVEKTSCLWLEECTEGSWEPESIGEIIESREK